MTDEESLDAFFADDGTPEIDDAALNAELLTLAEEFMAEFCAPSDSSGH